MTAGASGDIRRCGLNPHRDLAELELREPGDDPVGWAVRVAAAHRGLGRWDLARATLDDADADARTIAARGRIRLARGITTFWSSDLLAALAELDAGIALADDSVPPDERVEAEGMRALTAFLLGRLDAARTSHENATAAASQLPSDAVAHLPARITGHWLEIETRRAGDLVGPLRRVVAEAAGTEYAALALTALAWAQESVEDSVGVLRTVWELGGETATWHDESVPRALSLSVWFIAMTRRREFAAALAVLRDLQPDPAHALCPASWEARVLLETGEHERIVRMLEPCIALGPAHAPRTQQLALAVKAAAHAALRDGDSADSAFDQALTLSAITGLRRYLLLLPAELLDRLLDRAEDRAAPAPQVRGSSRGLVRELRRMMPIEDEEPTPVLSPRERLVLSRLAEGETPQRIAWLLSVSPNTVKSQIRSTYRKLGVGSRGGAIGRARVLGLIE